MCRQVMETGTKPWKDFAEIARGELVAVTGQECSDTLRLSMDAVSAYTHVGWLKNAGGYVWKDA
jgi:hypothetical protein